MLTNVIFWWVVSACLCLFVLCSFVRLVVAIMSFVFVLLFLSVLSLCVSLFVMMTMMTVVKVKMREWGFIGTINASVTLVCVIFSFSSPVFSLPSSSFSPLADLSPPPPSYSSFSSSPLFLFLFFIKITGSNRVEHECQ